MTHRRVLTCCPHAFDPASNCAHAPNPDARVNPLMLYQGVAAHDAALVSMALAPALEAALLADGDAPPTTLVLDYCDEGSYRLLMDAARTGAPRLTVACVKRPR